MSLQKSKFLFKAAADETRLRILSLLGRGELCVCDVMSVLKQPQSKISRHFAYLRRAGLVTARREGLWMYYRLAPGAGKIQKALLTAVKTAANELTELKKDSKELASQRKCLVACCS